MKKANLINLRLPDYTMIDSVSYRIDKGDHDSVHQMREILTNNSNLFSITCEFRGEIRVESPDYFRFEGEYLKVYRTGGIYIQFYEKHNSDVNEIEVSDEFDL